MKCYRCQEEKAVGDFPWKRKALGQRARYCKKCNNAWRMDYYRRMKAIEMPKIAARAKRYRDRLRELIARAKDAPCMDCNVKYPPFVMDFDHRVGSAKRFTLSRATTFHVRPERILEEIAKCDLVCANCHRIRTHNRRMLGAVGRRDSLQETRAAFDSQTEYQLTFAS